MKMPLALVSTMSSHSFSVTSGSQLMPLIPAQLTSTSSSSGRFLGLRTSPSQGSTSYPSRSSATLMAAPRPDCQPVTSAFLSAILLLLCWLPGGDVRLNHCRVNSGVVDGIRVGQIALREPGELDDDQLKEMPTVRRHQLRRNALGEERRNRRSHGPEVVAINC